MPDLRAVQEGPASVSSNRCRRLSDSGYAARVDGLAAQKNFEDGRWQYRRRRTSLMVDQRQSRRRNEQRGCGALATEGGRQGSFSRISHMILTPPGHTTQSFALDI